MITSLRSRSPGEERWGGKRGRKQRERAKAKEGRAEQNGDKGLDRVSKRKNKREW